MSVIFLQNQIFLYCSVQLSNWASVTDASSSFLKNIHNTASHSLLSIIRKDASEKRKLK